ncbi:MAG: glycosyltransferase [Candidatus Omnitrophica bacterium]|nr:glycosyltransferase [Candidatus Omnitrophota bacterium]
MRVLFICSAKADHYYPRNTQVLEALRKNFTVIQVSSSRSTYLARISHVLLGFLKAALTQKFDFIYTGFLAQPLAVFARIFSAKPIILDAFVSVYDVLCLDRKDFQAYSLIGKLSFWLDKISFSFARAIITDTDTSADFFSLIFNIRRDKFHTLYMGGEEEIFYTRQTKQIPGLFTIFFHGTYWPLHGIEYIIRAAKLLEDVEGLRFILLGRGKEKAKMINLSEGLGLRNISFLDWVSYEHLAEEIAKADICLGGHFSRHDKAARVISGKTYAYLAMGKPVIVSDNPATREVFTHLENVYMCSLGDEKSLAESIVILKDNVELSKAIAANGLVLFREKFSHLSSAKNISGIINHVL